jgi:two-component system CheB/CheR fusion protein
VNEELQSTNEELQTTKEETQSLNEELHSVNAELALKLETFEHATDDLLNLMNNIDVATIFLDAHLRVKRFTPQARHVAHLIDADVGRPLADLATHLDYPDLLSDAAAVIETLHASEKQVGAPDGSWYLVRIRPYRTSRNIVEGAVVTFIDITDAKNNESLQSARVLAESIVDAVVEPLLVLDHELRIVRANRAYYRTFRAEAAETEGRLIGNVGSLTIPELRARLERVLEDGTGFDDFEVEAELPGLGRRKLVSNARAFTPGRGTAAALVLLGFEKVPLPEGNASGAETENP